MTENAPLHPYPSPDERRARMIALADAAGGDLVQYGESVQRRPLEAVRVPPIEAGHDLPKVACTANIHGPEWIGSLVALDFLRRLGRAEDPVAALRHRCEVWVVPCLNPDGYAETHRRQGIGPLSVLRTNARGVDLNRNFPLPHGRPHLSWLGAGSPRPGDATYRGTAALSEPETRQLDELLTEQRFHASANLHSFMGTMIPARCTHPRQFATYKDLCRRFTGAQSTVRYRRLSSRLFDVFTGEMEDHQHHAHDTWAMCIETFPIGKSFAQHWRAPSTFWRFNPKDPSPWLDNDVPALAAWLNAALDLPRPGTLAG